MILGGWHLKPSMHALIRARILAGEIRGELKNAWLWAGSAEGMDVLQKLHEKQDTLFKAIDDVVEALAHE